MRALTSSARPMSSLTNPYLLRHESLRHDLSAALAAIGCDLRSACQTVRFDPDGQDDEARNMSRIAADLVCGGEHMCPQARGKNSSQICP